MKIPLDSMSENLHLFIYLWQTSRKLFYFSRLVCVFLYLCVPVATCSDSHISTKHFFLSLHLLHTKVQLYHYPALRLFLGLYCIVNVMVIPHFQFPSLSSFPLLPSPSLSLKTFLFFLCNSACYLEF